MGPCQLQRSLAARLTELVPQRTQPCHAGRTTQGADDLRREIPRDRQHRIFERIHARAITGHSLKLRPVGDSAAPLDEIVEPRGHSGPPEPRLPSSVEDPRENIKRDDGDEDPVRDHIRLAEYLMVRLTPTLSCEGFS